MQEVEQVTSTLSANEMIEVTTDLYPNLGPELVMAIFEVAGDHLGLFSTTIVAVNKFKEKRGLVFSTNPSFPVLFWTTGPDGPRQTKEMRMIAEEISLFGGEDPEAVNRLNDALHCRGCHLLGLPWQANKVKALTGLMVTRSMGGLHQKQVFEHLLCAGTRRQTQTIKVADDLGELDGLEVGQADFWQEVIDLHAILN